MQRYFREALLREQELLFGVGPFCSVTGRVASGIHAAHIVPEVLGRTNCRDVYYRYPGLFHPSNGLLVLHQINIIERVVRKRLFQVLGIPSNGDSHLENQGVTDLSDLLTLIQEAAILPNQMLVTSYVQADTGNFPDIRHCIGYDSNQAREDFLAGRGLLLDLTDYNFILNELWRPAGLPVLRRDTMGCIRMQPLDQSRTFSVSLDGGAQIVTS
ncbi:MAG: HNH endonuclease signature motif containing protein [Candidatus Dojkabacteria bacterium]